MPCDDGGYDNNRVELERAVCAACEMSKELRSPRPKFSNLTAKTQAWVARHDEIDMEREKAKRAESERKRIREDALMKLTAAERKVLGV